jgi:hypothetical protein
VSDEPTHQIVRSHDFRLRYVDDHRRRTRFQ